MGRCMEGLTTGLLFLSIAIAGCFYWKTDHDLLTKVLVLYSTILTSFLAWVIWLLGTAGDKIVKAFHERFEIHELRLKEIEQDNFQRRIRCIEE